MPYRPEDLDQMRLRQGEAAAKRKVREGQHTPSDPLYKFKNTGGQIGAPTYMDDVRGFMYDLNDTPTEGLQISPAEAAALGLEVGALGMTGGASMAPRAFASGARRGAAALTKKPLLPRSSTAKAPSLSGGVGKTGPKVDKRYYEADDVFDMSPEEIAKQKQTGEVEMSRVPSPERQAEIKRKAEAKKKRNAEAKRTTEPLESENVPMDPQELEEFQQYYKTQIFDPPAPDTDFLPPRGTTPKSLDNRPLEVDRRLARIRDEERLRRKIRSDSAPDSRVRGIEAYDDVGAGERKRQRDMGNLERKLQRNQGRDLNKYVGFKEKISSTGERADGSISDYGILRNPDKMSLSEADFARGQETFVGKGADIPKTKTKAAKKSERREGKRKLRRKDNSGRSRAFDKFGKSEATREDLFGVAGGLGAASNDEEINYSYGDD